MRPNGVRQSESTCWATMDPCARSHYQSTLHAVYVYIVACAERVCIAGCKCVQQAEEHREQSEESEEACETKRGGEDQT